MVGVSIFSLHRRLTPESDLQGVIESWFGLGIAGRPGGGGAEGESLTKTPTHAVLAVWLAGLSAPSNYVGTASAVRVSNLTAAVVGSDVLAGL